MNKKFLLALSVIGVFTLEGCAPVVVGAAAGGVYAMANRSHIKNLYHDTDIGNHIIATIEKHKSLNDAHIDVAVSHQNVLLAGQTPTPEQRIEAERIAAAVPGVRKIYNQITIAGPTSGLTRSSDSWITSKIKSKMLLEKNLGSTKIKVVTENGVVYLMGTTTQPQADQATELARQVAGVQKVVRLFEYL